MGGGTCGGIVVGRCGAGHVLAVALRQLLQTRPETLGSTYQVRHVQEDSRGHWLGRKTGFCSYVLRGGLGYSLSGGCPFLPDIAFPGKQAWTPVAFTLKSPPEIVLAGSAPEAPQPHGVDSCEDVPDRTSLA